MATDNYKGGVLAAQRIGEVLAGKGRILVVAWTPNSASTDARLQGFRETLAKEFPGIEIVDSQFPNPPTMEQGPRRDAGHADDETAARTASSPATPPRRAAP